MQNVPNVGLYRVALASNAAFSFTSGLVLAVAPERMAELLGIHHGWLLPPIGLGLIVFAALVTVAAARSRIRPIEAVLVSLADFAWVGGTFVLLTLLPDSLNTTGKIAAVLVAAAVLAFAVAQLAGVRRFLRETESGLAEWRYCVAADVDVDADAIWRVVSDLGGIARYMPTLVRSGVRDEAPDGVGAVRACTNVAGQSWAEEVISFDAGARSFDVRFLVEEPGFPFPMRAMYGGWAVSPAPGGSRVSVWWSVTPKTSVFPWLLVAIMGFSVDRDFPPVIARMAAAAKGEPLPRFLSSPRSPKSTVPQDRLRGGRRSVSNDVP